MLSELVSGMDRDAFENHVISMTEPGAVGETLRSLGCAVHGLGFRAGIPNPMGMWRLSGYLRSLRPDVLHTWMYHASLLGTLTAALTTHTPTAWGIHHADLEPRRTKWLTRLTARACARLSGRYPARIAYCSEAGRAFHTGIGYAGARGRVLPNGVDTGHFRPDDDARTWLAGEIGVSAQAPIISMVASVRPEKDHPTFIGAAQILHRQRPEVRFLLCGRGATWDNRQLSGPIAEAGMTERFHLLGMRKDVNRLMAGSTIVTSSSVSEAFPCVVCEAMACGTVCVVTDVGDCADIVGDAGTIVPPGNPQAIAEAWLGILDMGQEAIASLGLSARRRIEESFSLALAVGRYQELYRELVAADQPDTSVGFQQARNAAGAR
jgi:glycosyltransferase involved in cell wall biosynthesis